MNLTHNLKISEEARQLILLALALMVVGPRPGFDYAAGLAATELDGMQIITFMSMTRGGRPAREYLWMNYPAPTVLHDYRYLGNNKRQRERITRKARTWTAGLLRLPALERQAIVSAIGQAVGFSDDSSARESLNVATRSPKRKRKA